MSHHGFRVGDVYPSWIDSDGDVVIPLSEHSTVTFSGPDGRRELYDSFEQASAQDFEASIQAAVQDVDDIRHDQAVLMKELASFNVALLGAGEEAPEVSSSTSIQPVNPAGQIRNRAHGYKRRANELVELVKSRKALLDSKLGQKMAVAMAALGDMQKVVQQLEQVVYTVQLYLGRDEKVECLTEGEPAPAATPICIRQNVLYMDEECALVEEHGIDFSEIESFDRWLLSSPEHLAQVLPEPKGVVVLQVRRNKKDYAADSISEAIINASKHEENAKSYWLIKNGQRLHRIHANISVGPRLLPREDELDQFFFHRSHETGDVEAVRPGSREYLSAMESAGVVRRHYMQLALVLQGLLDRTQLFAPYKDGVRPNLLDPDSNAGVVHFLRDVEMTITDGRPEFRDWLNKMNANLQHGHRIVGNLPTRWIKDDESRITPKNAEGVNEDQVHTVLEEEGKLYFRFKRTDTVWDRYGPHDAKRAATYEIYRRDCNFLCIDGGVRMEDLKYYLNDRRHRSEYENMVPCLKSALAVMQEELSSEKPFRDLLLRKLEEAVPHNPCSQEQLEKLIRWWKTKTKEHRALLADDSKAFRMILSRYKAQAEKPMTDQDRSAMLEMIGRMSDTVFAYHTGGREFGLLRAIDLSPFFLREEVWRVTDGAPHVVSGEVVLAQKPDYEAHVAIYSTKAWENRLSFYSPNKVLSPELYPAVVEFVRSNPWFLRNDEGNESDKRLLAIYAYSYENALEIRATSIEMDPTSSGGWGYGNRKKSYQTLDDIPLPTCGETVIKWTGTAMKSKFSFRYVGGSRTHFSHRGEITLGWENPSSSSVAKPVMLFFDAAVLEAAKLKIGERTERRENIEILERWIRKSCSAAETFITDNWKQGHLTKYLAEGGDLEFFEDHLKTLPKYKPDAQFLDSYLTRCINAGFTPTDLSQMDLLGIEKILPPIVKDEDDFHSFAREVEVPEAEHQILVDSKWTPPPFIVSREED